jgi:hypothetical protein
VPLDPEPEPEPKEAAGQEDDLAALVAEHGEWPPEPAAAAATGVRPLLVLDLDGTLISAHRAGQAQRQARERGVRKYTS